jgi:glycosyltransferase involved in cell wall biosynthesis
MRVTHFALMSPHRAGLYGTVKDLIQGERFAGINAEFVDYGLNGEGRERLLSDEWLSTVHWQNALGADLAVRHTAMPKKITKTIPFLLALHGRPVNTFLLSYQEGRKKQIIENLYEAVDQKMFRGCLCFWEWNARIWRQLLSPHPVYCVNAPVNLGFFTPHGTRYQFSGEYDFRVLVADMWREDSCPVTALYKALDAAAVIKERHGLRVQVNALGVPQRARELLELIRAKSGNEFLGEVLPLVETPEYLFRSADAVLSGTNIASRIVREALACGTPVISLDPNPEYDAYLPDYHAGEQDLSGVMMRVFETPREATRMRARAYAETHFSLKRAGEQAKEIFQKVLSS